MSQTSLEKVRSWMQEQGLDAYLVGQAQNRSYLSGWHNDDTESGSSLLISQDKQIVLTNALYDEVAAREAVGWQVVVPPARAFAKSIAEIARDAGWQKIGFESNAFTYALYAKIIKELDAAAELVPVDEDIILTIRAVKTPQEIDYLRKAVAITDQTFAHICEWIQPGMTEKEVAWEIESTYIKLGADGHAFPSIIASGPNGSMPHAEPGNRKIQKGELITIDMGARYKGYHADMTRTICLGEPAETRMVELYETVLLAMKTCEAGLHAGITGKAADALARDVLATHDLGEYYVHGTGHGIGLQIHESPGLGKTFETETLPAGSVVTVEPGVYIPGWSGLRIEDSVLVLDDGFEVLTQSPTALVLPR